MIPTTHHRRIGHRRTCHHDWVARALHKLTPWPSWPSPSSQSRRHSPRGPPVLFVRSFFSNAWATLGLEATPPSFTITPPFGVAVTQPVRTLTRKRQCHQQFFFFSALLFCYGGFVQVQDESDNGGIERRWICWVNQGEQWVMVF